MTPRKEASPTHITIVIDKSYTEDLRERMEKHGISQQAMADELGKKREEVNRWLVGHHTPTLERVKQIELAYWRIMQRKQK